MTINAPSSLGGTPPASGTASPRDLREWITRVEAIGQIQRIAQEVDHDEEMGAITYMAHQQINAPAPFFERIKGCPPGFRAIWNLIGSSVDRLAITMGEPTGLGAMELIERCKTKFTRGIPPVVVDGADAPVNANHQFGDDIDIRIFPAARHWAGDGGR